MGNLPIFPSFPFKKTEWKIIFWNLTPINS